MNKLCLKEEKFATLALIGTAAAVNFDTMNEDELLVNLSANLSSALSSEARGDGDAAVAKTAAIKNIQKSLTARILKRLDDGQPLVEVARKMKAIEGMQP
jgi:predicted transcriptional regulator